MSNFIKFIKKSKYCSSPHNTHFCTAKNLRQQNFLDRMHFGENDVLALEVSQNSISALPCCMGVTFFFDPRPAWERDFHSCRHLPSENAIFFIFSTPPQRESKKSMKSHLEAPSWTTHRERCEKQIGTKTSPSSLDYERDVFFKSTKLHRIETELCVFLEDYNEL